MRLFKNKQINQRAIETLEPVDFNSSTADVSYHPDTPSNPISFGKEFNLIRAVSEYGADRIKLIDRELQSMAEKTKNLSEERAILQKLVDVVK